MRLKDKVVIVTGGGSGFGEGIASRLAEEGAKVMVNDIHVTGAERVAHAIRRRGGVAEFVQADVAVGGDWAAMTKATLTRSAASTWLSTTLDGPTGTSRCWRSPKRSSNESTRSTCARSSSRRS